MRRGDVFWADLAPRSGSEQRGRRPVVVVSHDGLNEMPQWRSIIVVPLSTSARQMSRGPSVVTIPPGVAGLLRESGALCHQVTTIDRSKLVQKIGTLPRPLILAVNQALRISLDLFD